MKLDDLPIHTSLHAEPALEFACGRLHPIVA